ncbi:MAG: hypothetical protein ACFFA1_02155 [Promethearchaeota archaeon]
MVDPKRRLKLLIGTAVVLTVVLVYITSIVYSYYSGFTETIFFYHTYLPATTFVVLLSIFLLYLYYKSSLV